ncbi:MAG: hypothetical protein EZS28_024853, partial [Streblomastix strix]
EEGGNEEVESQLINKGKYDDSIKDYANQAKIEILNLYIGWWNPRPW